jgi:hypothetical protein
MGKSLKVVRKQNRLLRFEKFGKKKKARFE